MRGACALGFCFAALVLAACGGGGASTESGSTTSSGGSTTARSGTTPSSTTASSITSDSIDASPSPKGASGAAAGGPSTEDTTKRPSRKRQGAAKRDSKQSSSADQRHPPRRASAPAARGHSKLVRVPPISAAPKAGSKKPAPGVKTIEGGDNSVQEYGVEADESSRREAAVALQSYLNDRLDGDWAAACAILGQKPRQQLEEAAETASQQGTEVSGCAATMALFRESPARLGEQATITEVLSFRGGADEIAGDPSFLIFAAPPTNALYSMPMYLEEGSWKVGLTRAAELPVQ